MIGLDRREWEEYSVDPNKKVANAFKHLTRCVKLVEVKKQLYFGLDLAFLLYYIIIIIIIIIILI